MSGMMHILGKTITEIELHGIRTKTCHILAEHNLFESWSEELSGHSLKTCVQVRASTLPSNGVEHDFPGEWRLNMNLG